MSNENLEVMETTMDLCEGCVEEVVESKGGFGKTALIGVGVLAVAGLAVAAVKKIKNKKSGEPKQKTRFKLFARVPENDGYVELPADNLEAEEN